MQTRTFFHAHAPHTAYQSEDRPNKLPVRLREAALEVEWLDDEVYGLYADADWRSLFPQGQSGFVALGGTRERFAIGMYHQLHCLEVLRTGYAAGKGAALEYPGNGTIWDHHVNHCLNYLREVVLCNADTTLIPAIPEDGEFIATSMGVVHRCKDWTQLREIVERNMDETRAAEGVRT
jgi:hypothetical protein